MASDFEIWIKGNEGSLHEDAKGLFADSLRCLKNDICRPAYLLAYQGMMVTIREALKAGQAPQGFTPGEWTDKLKGISKEEAWDTAVFGLIQQKENKSNPSNPKDAPLHISDTIRSQFEYWRILRNNCAHYKKDPLIKAHVLSLYNFISTHLLNITVTGGAQKMLDKLRVFLDPTKTPSNAPIEPWIEEMARTVPAEELPEFMEKMLRLVSLSYQRNPAGFVQTILSQDGAQYATVKEELVKLILNKRLLLPELLNLNPSYVLDLYTEPQAIREFWHSFDSYPGLEILPVIEQLLVAGKIPKGEHLELFAVLQKIFYDKERWVTFSPTLQAILESKGYFEYFKTRYFNTEHINNIARVSALCYHTDFLLSHISSLPLTAENIDSMKTIIEGNPVPFTLRDRFRKSHQWNPEFHQRLTEAANSHGIQLPAEWFPVP